MDIEHYRNRHSLGSKVARAIWNCVWLILFRPSLKIAPTRIWRIALLRLFGARVSWRANVHPSCRIWQPWKLEMGPYACLASRVDCYNADWVRIGARATVSQDAFLCTASHDLASATMELTTAPIAIGDEAWVAARALVLPGRSVGVGAVVAAAAVVTKDVPPWTVVGGNPARVIGAREIKPV